ncbi:glycoside hydrolase family 3 C-terminal domain-containing protein [bacterium]|nr:glycoside hydrolase family 3 C-terminal domain-containing protein [bacterium]
MEKSFTPAVSFEAASERADSIVQQLTLDEKLSIIGGVNHFFIHGLERFGFPDLYMADATQGVHIRNTYRDQTFEIEPMERSTAFPCPLLLAATWNTELAYQYAKAVGEECRLGGVSVLLGPGLNLYRISQCGRNFEYFGEDPFLVSQMIRNYISGLQSTGTIGTLKHFVANNTDFFRRRSNSVVSERALHELYTQGFRAGIEAGAMAVMTSYNLVNGEWSGQSRDVIHDVLRNKLGFRWMVMTDWWSVWDGEKVIESGQDLEMPGPKAVQGAKDLLNAGKIEESDIDRMASSILTTLFAMGIYNRLPVDHSYDEQFPEHEKIALQTAREGIVLLKNEDMLPIPLKTVRRILITGEYVTKNATGGGSAYVEGYNTVTVLEALKGEFGDKIIYDPNPTEKVIEEADMVLVNTGTSDSEGWDRPFDLPDSTNQFIIYCLDHNPKSVVIVHSGGGINMSPWQARAGAILHTWYKGQIGNVALAEILSGKTNPSGKLPITIEKRFEDSPGYGYIPEGEQLYHDWPREKEYEHPVYDVDYKEDIFIGYRWYEHKKIAPLYPFGHGLSYTQFEYTNLDIPEVQVKTDTPVRVSVQIKNIGGREGAETVQLYVRDEACSLPRPEKELKAFAKVCLQPGERQTLFFELGKDAFAFWHPDLKDWTVEPGVFAIMIGKSSQEIVLEKSVTVVD